MKRSSQLASHIFERPFGTGFRAEHGLIVFSFCSDRVQREKRKSLSRRMGNEYELRENEGC